MPSVLSTLARSTSRPLVFGIGAALLVAAGAVGLTAFSRPHSLEQCRAEVARDARTEAGAKAALYDCSMRFAKPVQTPPAPKPSIFDAASPEECSAAGGVYEAASQHQCLKPCTEEIRAINEQNKRQGSQIVVLCR